MHDGIAYVAGMSLTTVDVRNPATPKVMGYVNTGEFAESIRLIGSHALVAEGSGGASVIDVSNPRAPAHVADLPDDGEYHRFVDVEGADGLAYVADAWEGIRIFDVSHPQDPREVGFLDLPGMSVQDLDIVDGRAYAGNSRYLVSAIVSDPNAPYLEHLEPIPGEPLRVFVAGDHVYVASCEAGLLIYRPRRGF